MSIPRPAVDPFYATVDPSTRPGNVLRSRTVEVVTSVDVTAWQLVYGSTGALGQPIAVSGTVLVPASPWTGQGPRPILSYGVGVHGLGRDAAPSYHLRAGTEADRPLIELALARGWAVAVTDGDGLGLTGPHTYGAGLPGGHALLDIARASVHCGMNAEAPVLLWGYSEGGRCAAWAAELQPDYAPELPLTAVAAGGVPADLRAVAKAIDGGAFSGLGLAVLIGLAQAHQIPALVAILSPAGWAAAEQAATKDVIGLILDHPEPMRHHTVRDEPWDEPVWRELLDRETNGQRPPLVPVHLYHVTADDVVPVEVGRALRQAYDLLGVDVTWVELPGDDHLSGAIAGAPGALEWLEQRLA